MNAAAQPAEIKNLTGLRAFAAMSVVLLHVRYPPLADQYGEMAFLFVNYGLGVQVFFVLSGFILGYVHDKDFDEGISAAAYLRFAWLRLSRIYPVHLFFLLLIAAQVVPGMIGSETDTPGAFVANVTLTQAWGGIDQLSFNGPAWTISAEWFAYLCFPLLAFLTRRWHPVFWCVMICALVAIIPTVTKQGFKYGLQVLDCLNYFSLGFFTYRIALRLPSSGFVWRLGGTVLGPVILALLYHDALGIFSYAFSALTALLILSLFKAGPVFGFSNPVSVYMGKTSYSLYMSHFPALSLLRYETGTVWPLWAEVGILVAVSLIVYHLIEEPARIAMRRILKNPQA